MSKKLVMDSRFFLISLLILGLIFNGFSYMVYAPDINNFSKDDFFLKEYKERSVFGDYHSFTISYDKDLNIVKSDISYKIVGSVDNVKEFNRCVDLSYNVIGRDIIFKGYVKEWGIYSVDIQPIIKDVTVSQFAWWNSSFIYRVGSVICDNITDYAMPLWIGFDNDDYDINMNGMCNENYSDIRFVGKDNITELYHWIEFYNSSFALFWINVSSNDYINMYYNNSLVGNSTFNNPSKVFYLWENFTDISDWSNNGDSHFSVYDGKLEVDSSSSYGYIYRDIDSNKYFFKTRMISNTSTSSNCLVGPMLGQDDQSSYSFEDNSIMMFFYSTQPYIYVQAKDTDSNLIQTTYQGVDSVWYRCINYFNGEQNIYDDNMNILGFSTNSNLDDNFEYLSIITRNVDGIIVNYDWLFVGLYEDVNTPSFCDWVTPVSYCEYSNVFVNMSPYPYQIVSGLNISFLTVEYQILDGQADSINISIAADNGLFYINDTTYVYNGTYSLNVMLANFSIDTNYTWFVNITNDDCVVSRNYTFSVSPYNLYGLLQVINYKENLIYENMLSGDDDMNIGLTDSFLSIFLTLVFFLVFFIYGYTVNKRSAGAFLMFSGFIFLSLEYLISSYLHSIVLAFFGAFGIFIIILGIRKWFFMPEGEKTKSEGQ